MKKSNEAAISRVILATGISSVVTQLLTIREFLAQFQGNEIVIALILFVWLILGGMGTLLARFAGKKLKNITVLGYLSLILSALPPLQMMSIRLTRDLFFTHGSSVGFYSILGYSFFLMSPYCLILGFVLPFSLFIIRLNSPDFSGARVYIIDNIGDISGGILFSFILVFLASPMQAVFISNLPLAIAAYMLFPSNRRLGLNALFSMFLVFLILLSGMILEPYSLRPKEGLLVHYRESLYGRITVHKNREQHTLFEDNVPVYSSHNLVNAEETVHYPLSQTLRPKHVLLISTDGGVTKELDKYALNTIDYLEINPEILKVIFKYNLVKKIPALNAISMDARAYLTNTEKAYDVIMINLPEPYTFQLNRFFTHEFFRLTRNHLTTNGILSFSVQGYDNYMPEIRRQKISSLHNTVSDTFKHVLLLPGQKIYFLCSNKMLNPDIPVLLSEKNISTEYIHGYYYGNLTQKRINDLNSLVDLDTVKNKDLMPNLMRLVFSQWFEKFSSSPVLFLAILCGVYLLYFIRIRKEEFVIFSTGCYTMAFEILVIFAFQIYFGYIYFQIGVIITIFLAGLLPGAIIGKKFIRNGRTFLAYGDLLLLFFTGLFALSLMTVGEYLPMVFFLLFGLAISLVCGFQFPIALNLHKDDNPAATRFFSADLMGAACGIIFTSILMIPFIGILWSILVLFILKSLSLLTIVVGLKK